MFSFPLPKGERLGEGQIKLLMTLVSNSIIFWRENEFVLGAES
jgi:hypothetical protein